VVELNIGHFLIGEAIMGGLAEGCAAHASGHRSGAPRWISRGAGQFGSGHVILGIGTDLVDIRRIERTIARHGDRFLDRIFTATERRIAERRANPAANLRQTLCRQGSLRQGARNRISRRGFLS